MKAREIKPGDKFGNIIVLKEIERWRTKSGQPIRQFTYLCPRCGEENKILRTGLGRIKMCLKCTRETVKSNLKHGDADSKLYWVWQQIRYRCSNPNNKAYKNYGGRGIKVVEEWNDYGIFKKWADENGYDGKLSIERIDNNGGYSPDNCTWIPIGKQTRNQRRNRFTTKKVQIIRRLSKSGVTTKQLSEAFGIPYRVMYKVTSFESWKDIK